MGAWTHPVYEVEVAGQRLDPAVVSFWVQAQGSAADSGRLVFSDPEVELAPTLARGLKAVIRWGYQDDPALTVIFEGLVRAVQPDGLQVALELIDYQAILQAPARRITRTWEHVAPAELAGDLIAGTGLTLQASVPGTQIDRFPVHHLTPKEALQQLTTWLARETGEDHRFHVRAGELVLCPPDYSQAPVLALETGMTLIDRRPGKLGMTLVETLVAPVLHGQVVTVDGARFFVEEVVYRWNAGGRTLLQVVPCVAS
jgi:hypothetical protein